MRVFFDASVIIAALLSAGGGSSQLLKYVKLGKIVAITSQTVIEEILEEDKSERIKKSKREIGQFIADSQFLVRKPITPGEIEPYYGLVDIEDAHLIAGANLTRCRYLATLDKKHLLRNDIQRKFLPLKIASPGQLLESLSRKNNHT